MKERGMQFAKYLLSHKQALVGAACLAFFLSLAPLHFAQANIFSDIFGLISNLWLGWAFGIPLAIITALLVIGALLAVWLSAALVAIVKMFIVSSLSVPILPGEGIDVVTQGWEFSRDVVNITFILILVFIGLATILRLQNYSIQKTLPLLIVMALLVNFSGVFVAFIVDIANLVTNAFVAKLGGFDMAVDGSMAIIQNIASGLLGIVTNITDFGAILVPPVTAAIYLIFYLLFSAVMFIVALLIIVRVGILWALTILAPIAFASYILPATRGLWSQWLKQLIQWSIIGIPIAFFLWLAQIAATATSAAKIKESFLFGVNPDCYNPTSGTFLEGCASGADPGLVEVIASLIGPIIALLMVAMGIMVAMQFAPQGANMVINYGKKYGLTGLGAAGTFAWRRTGAGIQKFGKNIRKRAQGTWDVEKDTLTGGEKALGAFAKGTGLTFLGRQLGKTPGVGRFSRRGAELFGSAIEYGSRKVTTQLHQRDNAQMLAAKRAGANQDPDDNANEFNEAIARGDWNKAVGILTATLEDNGDTDEFRARADSGRIKWKDIDTALQHAERHGNPGLYRPIIKGFLDKIQDGEKEEDGTLLHSRYWTNIHEKWRPGEIRNKLLDIQSIKGTKPGEDVLRDIFLKADTNVALETIRHPNRETREWAVQFAESLGAEWFLENGRQDTLEAIVSSGGRSMGVPVFGGLTRDGIRRMASERTERFTDEQLDEKVATATQQIEALRVREEEENAAQRPVRGIRNQRLQLQKERAENQEALRLRRLALDVLQTERADAQAQISDLDAQREAGTLNEAQYYREKTQPQRTLERVERELRRRGPTGVPGEEQPLSLQLANVRAREEQLEKDAIRTVGPVRVGGGKGISGELAREELKKVRAQRKELEQRVAELPEGTFLIEGLINKAEEGIREEQRFIDSLESGVADLRQKEQTMEQELAALRQTQASDPDLVPQDLITELEQRLQETRSRRVGFGQELQEHQAKANVHQDRKEVLSAGWKVLSKAEQPIKGVEELYEENVTKAEQAEQKAQREVAQLEHRGSAPTVIAKARAELAKTQENRKGWGNDLGRFQRLQELKTTLAEAQARQKEREAALEQLKQGVQDAEDEIKGMNVAKQETQRQIEDLETRLASQRERATEELLSENPGLGTSSREFQRTMEEKMEAWEQQEPVQERISQASVLQEQQQELQRELEQRQRKIRELQEDKENLARGVHRTRRRGPTQDLNQQIAQERSALYTERTTYENNQRRLEQLNNELRNMRERARADVFWNDPELHDIRASAQETQRSVEAAPLVSELQTNIYEREQYLSDVDKEIARREKQKGRQEKRAQKAGRAAEKAGQEVGEVEVEQEEVKEGKKTVKPKRKKRT